MQVTIGLELDTEFYQLEDMQQAEQFASQTNQTIYCWKTLGSSNWLERGISISDVLGLVVLPRNLPEYIQMPDDPEQDPNSI